MKKRVLILGCTGSIGKSSLDVVATFPDMFEITGLTAHSNRKDLLDAGKRFNCNNLCLTGISGDFDGMTTGKSGLFDLIRNTPADLVVNGISGSAGLMATSLAIERGLPVALANKESLVMAGHILLNRCQETGSRILPVDSEHAALFYLSNFINPGNITRLILTASGGPFRNRDAESLKHVTFAEALKHPTWSMGKKISIDSATLANKGLEVIEACVLFSAPTEKIEVVIHPQSCIHSMVQTIDGSVYCQMSNPDMRLPIQNAMTFPEMMHSPFAVLDFTDLHLDFSKPDKVRFPMLQYAYDAAKAGGSYPIVYNAVNEIAVDAFADGHIDFTGIPSLVSEVFSRDWTFLPSTIEEVLEQDSSARLIARELLTRISSPGGIH